MDVSVIIVSYNVSAFLEKCLLSVLRSVGDLDVEVIVVDNNSVDNSAEMVRDHFPEVQLIANSDNKGFAKANNQGIEEASGDYILILNPDTVVTEDTLSTCVRFMREHEDAGAVGVKMVDGTGTFLPESKRGLPSPMSSLFKMTGVNSLFPKSNYFNSYYQGGLDPEETNQVPVLTGAFFFARGELLKKIGGFDEDYFMYGEDIDLSYRVLKEGYNNYYLPETSIIHYKGESTKRSSLEYVKTFYRAMLIFVSKHYTGFQGQVLKQFLWLGIVVRAALSGVRRFLLKLLWPLIDTAVIIVSILAIKWTWATYYFKDAEHFDSSFDQISIPVYTGAWLVGLTLFGAYDSGRSNRRVTGGVVFGTVLILLIYALLPGELRSSRALILLSAVVIAFALNALHAMRARLRSRSTQRRIAIVGSESEARRIMELLNRISPGVEIAGAVGSNDENSDFFLAGIESLDDIVREYRIDELIFSSSDIEFSSINKWMTHFGDAMQYRIASRESDHMVGSDSKVAAGQLYTTRIEFGISNSVRKRNKRLFDLVLASLVLVMSPILAITLGGRRVISRAWQILQGGRTWVGYDPRDPFVSELPRLPMAYVFPTAMMSTADEIHTLNYLYAREYSVWKDIELLMRSSK